MDQGERGPAAAERLLPAGLEELNETVMEGGGAQAIIEAAETLPVMAERRLGAGSGLLRR
jgi:hypothetical protein